VAERRQDARATPSTSASRSATSAAGAHAGERLRTLFLALACGCGATTASAVKIAGVGLEGDTALSEGDILDGLRTHPPRGLIFKDYAEYDEVAVASDRDRIASYYQRHGYFAARVTEVKVARAGSDRVAVTFRVSEGVPTRLKEIRIEGMPARTADGDEVPLRQLVQIEEGKVYEEEPYLATKARLQRFLVRRGYAYAEVVGRVEVDPARREAVVRIDVTPGPVVTMGRVEVKGLEELPESVVRNRITWDEGDRYDPRQLERTKGRLYQLGYLSSVDIELQREGKPDVLPTVIAAHETAHHELRLGGGAALDNANLLLRPRFGYLVRGFLDPLLTLELDARPGFIVIGLGQAGQLAGSVGASLDRNDLFAPRLHGSVAVTAEVTQLQTYSARELRSKIELDRWFLDDHLLLGLGYQLRLLAFASIAEALTPADRARVGLPASTEGGLGLSYALGYLEETIAYDLRDNRLDPKNGAYFELRAEEAGPYSGSQFPYVKLTPEARGYVSPIGWLVVAARVRYGDTLSGEPPITQRFFSGGASDHRGFTFRRLSPMSSGTIDGATVPIGGTTLIETGLELRVRLFRFLGNWVGVVAFADGGDVTLTRAEIDPTNLHWAIGGGLRYNTLVGPLRFDVGYRLNRFGPGEPDPGDRVAFHLSLGQAF
jgi:outer membrane protein insertion porin family